MIFQNAASFSFISSNSGFRRGVQFAVSDLARSAASLPMIEKSLLGGLILRLLDCIERPVQVYHLHSGLRTHRPAELNCTIVHIFWAYIGDNKDFAYTKS